MGLTIFDSKTMTRHQNKRVSERHITGHKIQIALGIKKKTWEKSEMHLPTHNGSNGLFVYFHFQPIVWLF